MRKIWATALLAFGLTLCALTGRAQAAAPAVAQTYCNPPNVIHPLDSVASVPADQNWAHAESCPGNPGDNWTDGPVQPAPASWSTASFSFNTPAMTWYVQGQRVYTPVSTQTVNPNTTTYYFLNAQTAVWVPSNIFTPPPGTSLEYTVVSGPTGITSVTPAQVAVFIPPNLGGAWVFAQRFGVVAGIADNTTPMQNLVNAVCGMNGSGTGVDIQLPLGNVLLRPGGVNVPCSGVRFHGYGPGSPKVTGHFRLAIPPGTMIGCYASGSGPLIDFVPTDLSAGANSTFRTNNGLFSLQVSDNGNNCDIGVQMTAQNGFIGQDVSCVGFTSHCLDQYSYFLSTNPVIIGSNNHPTWHNIDCMEGRSGAGDCLSHRGSYDSVLGEGGDTFNEDLQNFNCAMNATPCLTYDRSDNNWWTNVHIVRAFGDNPSPAPDAIAYRCGSESNGGSGYLGDNDILVTGWTTCPSPSPNPTGSPTPTPQPKFYQAANSTVILGYKRHDGGGPPPNIEVGGSLFWDDDAGNKYAVNQAGLDTDTAPFYAFGSSSGDFNVPDTGIPLITADSSTTAGNPNNNPNLGLNLYLGTRYDSSVPQCAEVRFATAGMVMANRNNWLSKIDCLTGGLGFQGSTTSYNALQAVVSGGSFTNIANLACDNGGSLGATTYYVKLTGVNSFGETLPSGQKNVACAANQVLHVPAIKTPNGLTSYNVYVSNTGTGGGGAEVLQTTGTHVTLGVDWIEPTSGLTGGASVPTNDTSSGGVVTPGGVQPNGSTGGYSGEFFPAGATEVHPRVTWGTCATVATGGTVCTFSNSFAFADTNYQCSFAVEGTSAIAISYDTKNTTNFKAYSASGTPTVDYTCFR